MAPLHSACAGALLLLSAVSAHFTLQTPPTIGFEDSDEAKGPCGGFTPDFSKTVTDFHVGGQPVGAKMLHSATTWLFRATLDETASGNWTKLHPIIAQSGLGEICMPEITAPEEWVGKNGVFSIVAHPEDGVLYQCSIVKFVSGKGEIPSSGCKNATSIQVYPSDDVELAKLTDNENDGQSSPSDSTTATAPASSTSPTSNTSPKPTNAAVGLVQSSLSMTNLFVLAAVGCLGAAYVL